MAEETKPLLDQEQKKESDDLTSPFDHQLRLPESFPASRARLLSSVVLLLYMAAFVGSVPLQSQYLYLRLHPEYFNKTDNSTPITNSCVTSKNDPRLRAEAALQARVAEMLLFFTLASTGPMLVAVIVLGSYSDVLGRKFLFIFPTLTGLLKMVGITLIINLELSLTYFYVIFVLDGLGGSFCGLFMATSVYTSDLTSPKKKRTLALTILQVLSSVASSAANIGVGYLIRYVSFFYAALLPTITMGAAVALVIFTLPESLDKATRQSRRRETGIRNPLKYVKDSFGFCLSVTTLRRVQFALGFIMLALGLVTFYGRTLVEVLFQLNAPFCWHSDEVGVYAGANVIVRAVGSLLAVHFLQKCMSDVGIVIVTLLPGLASFVLEGLATSTAMLYISLVVGMLSQTPLPVARSILSKMAGPSKQGALFAIVAVVDTLCTLLSVALYSTVYQATVAHMRGAVFLFMSSLVFLTFLLALAFKCVTRGGSLSPEPEPRVLEPAVN